MKNTQQGSTLAVVLLATFAISLVAVSVYGLINFQRNMAVRRELQFQANNVAETAMDYAFAYVSNDVKRRSIEKSEHIPQTEGTYAEFTFDSNAKAFLTAAIPAPSGFGDATSTIEFSELSVRILPASKSRQFTVKESVSGSRFNDLDGQIVFERTVPVVARVTASMPGSRVKYTAYIQKEMAFDEVPMFQKAINFQGQLHLHRGYPILGGVHTNGNLVINAHNEDNAKYYGLVTCAGRFYRGTAFETDIGSGGYGADPYGYCPENADSELDFRDLYDENIKLAATNTETLKIITSDPTDPVSAHAKYAQLDTDFDSRMTDWKVKALTTFKGNLMDKSHDVAAMLPPGCEKYRLDDASTSAVNEFANGTYVLLHPNITDTTHDAYNTDNFYQFARKATLLFRVECLADYAGTTNVLGDVDTTERTYKWIVKAYKKLVDDQNDANWVALPLPPGVIGQTKVQTWTPADAPNAQYEIATNVIDTTRVAGANAANPHLQGLFEEFKIDPGTYAIDNGGVTITSVGTATVDSGTWPHAGASGLGSLQAAGYVTGFALPYSYDTSTGKFAPDYTLALGSATAPELITDTTTASTKTGNIDPLQQAPGHGFFDCRLGRGVSPVTINIAALKEVLDGTDTSAVAVAFRTLLGVGDKDDYNGLVYVEFPTSLKTVAAISKRCYESGTTPYPGDMSAVDSYAFAIGDNTAIEKRHPDRMLDTDTRADRTDNILPIAKSLRGYPASYDNSEIARAKWAIPALVLVNGKKLPAVAEVTGLSISTNAPLYVIGSYNADGNFATGTNISLTYPTAYAENDTGWGEVSAGLFSDTLTILSDTWGKPKNTTKAVPDGTEQVYNRNTRRWETVQKYKNYNIVDGNRGNRFLNSFDGGNWTSGSLRKVEDGQVEISACILTGEYPIFEFFLHALENWGNYYNSTTSPICIKGAVVGMFHSEIQHIKGAYGRDQTRDIQVYYHGHGDSAIPAVRLHKQLTLGIFPPGTPKARDYSQKSFAFLRPSVSADASTLSAAGF